MDEEKKVIIQNGEGTIELLNGAYNVTAEVNGYDASSIDPKDVTITDGSNTFNFTISASGSLTIHVSENGEAGGVAVTPATFVRCDSTGQEYGTPVVSNQEGNAVFENIPYSASGDITIYYKQTSSDGNHNFSNALAQVIMTEANQIEEVQNSLPAEQTFKLTDKNYANLPITSGSMTFVEKTQ